MNNSNMNKLNVTEGEWCTDLYCDGYSMIFTNDDDELVATVYETKNNAILMSQSKKLYEQLANLNKLISLACGEGYCTDELFKSQVQTTQLLRTCRGE